ncbi:hypothetical protein QUB70_19770 [Microcoleus sp. A003_D6]
MGKSRKTPRSPVLVSSPGTIRVRECDYPPEVETIPKQTLN